MNILFLSQRVPYPPNRGDKITTWKLIERLMRTHEVTSLSFAHDEDDVAAARELERKGVTAVTVPHHERAKRLQALPLLATKKPLTLGVYGSRLLQERVDERLRWADVGYAYSSSMGAYFVERDLPWIMHFAELDSDKWRQYAERTKPPMKWVYRREWKTLERFETRVAHAAYQNVFCTPLEERIFQETIPGAPSTVLRNGVDLEYYSPRPEQAEPAHLVFTGVMDYLPNIDGCQHFIEEILPLVRARHPATKFTIVGSRPTQAVLDMQKTSGVTVTGFVDDTRDYLQRAAISVAPLRIARGIQNKVLEAMAMGLPVVGTTSATQGVGGEHERDYLVADTAADQAAAIVRLLDDDADRRALGERARSFVEDNYAWDATLAPLDALISAKDSRITTS